MTARYSDSGSFLARTWFPVAMILLFLLAIPGVVFFIMRLAGEERATGQWLQDTFGISYSMALLSDWPAGWYTWWPALILLLLPLFILILYFLKLKRKPMSVPSTFLWKKSIEDMHVNSLFQWLRRNVLLVLQLLIALFLIYAVMGFRIYANVSKGKHFILMIDNSASMTATDADGLSRLEWARREALKEIDAARADDVGMVIAFNSRASTLQTYTGDKAKLRQAVLSIQPTPKPTRIEEAWNLADSLANQIVSTEAVSMRPEQEKPGPEAAIVQAKGIATEVYLYSDGRFPDLTEAVLAQLNAKQAGNSSALGNLNLHFHSAGTPGPENVNNLGIVAFDIVRVPEKKEDANPTVLKLQALVRIANFKPLPATDVKLFLDVRVNGQLEHTLQEKLKLEARAVGPVKDADGPRDEDQPGQQTVIFRLPDLDASADIVLHAYLPDVKDDLALDNQAWVAIGQRRKAKVLIVGDKDMILEAFFLQKAVAKIAQVDQITPADLSMPKYLTAAQSGEYDLVIFDRCAPRNQEEMPQANTLFIDQAPPPWERGSKVLKDVPLIHSGKNHSLLQQILVLEKNTGVHELFVFDLEENLQANLKDKFTTKPEEKDKKLLPGITRLIETTGDTPAVFAVGRDAYTDVVMAFPLVDDKGNLVTNWSLKQSFALFLRNALYTLGNIRDEVRAESVNAGETMAIKPEAGVKSLTIVSPAGMRQTLKKGSRPDFIFTGTDELGVYAVERDDGVTQHFTVNLLDANESNLQPRAAVRFGDEQITAGSERRQPRDIWKWIVLLALGLLLIEWYVYNRRVHV